MSPKNITIIGSLNTDLVTRTRRLPAPGETLTAKSFNTAPGGKGANQAAAAARLSGDGVVVKMVGCVGGDEFGRDLKQALVDSGVDVEGVVVDKVEKSGTAIIIVSLPRPHLSGEESVCYVLGSGLLTRQWIIGRRRHRGKPHPHKPRRKRKGHESPLSR